MERKSFIWALDALRSGEPLQVLDSYLISEGRCRAYCATDAAGKYHLTPLDDDLVDVLSKVYREHQLLDRLRKAGPDACYFFFGETRVRVSIEELEEYLRTESLPSGLEVIQIPKPAVVPTEYSLKALLKGTDYNFSLFLHEGHTKKEIKSASRLRTVSQIVKTTLKGLSSNQTVVSATFKFITDEQQALWLTDINRCLVDTSPSRLFKNPLKTPKSLRPKGLNSSHQTGLGTSLRKDVSGSKLQVSSRSKKGLGSKRLKGSGPALSCNRNITSATLSLLHLAPKQTGKFSK